MSGLPGSEPRNRIYSDFSIIFYVSCSPLGEKGGTLSSDFITRRLVQIKSRVQFVVYLQAKCILMIRSINIEI